MATTKVIPAAGGIVWRKAPPTGKADVEVLLVHRPGYDDWTFPKGKADPGEPLPVTAIREVLEETGYDVTLGHPLPEVSYRVRGGVKVVAYWTARITEDSTTFEPNREVDKIKWFTPREARKKLTYEHDLRLLETFEDLVEAKLHKSRSLIVLRHAKALPREGWAGGDLDRPLTEAGRERASMLVPLFDAFGVRQVVSSPAVRCVQTVEPFAAARGRLLQVDDRLAEGVSSSAVHRAVLSLVDTKKSTVMCTHRPTMPDVYEALGISGPVLSPGQALVLHHRKGKILASELV